MKTKWVAGMAVMCLVTAAAASGLMLVAIKFGFFDAILPNQTKTTSTKVGQTSNSQATTAKPTTAQSVSPSVTPTPTPTMGPPDQNAFEKIYDDVSPSVVAVEVEVTETGTSIRRTNAGSGLIINETGYIVTNAGILSIALNSQANPLPNAAIIVKVKGIDIPFTASFVGQDVMTGLAVLKIEPLENEIKPAAFAANQELKVGQAVLAIGYPENQFAAGGLSNGLITGLYRTVVLEDGISMQMIETNAPVSQACSGGPLLDLDGAVIGLTNCDVNSGTIDTISYVTPSNTVQTVAFDLINHGEVSGRSYLGVTVYTEDNFLAQQRIYNFPDGLYISKVVKNSPAYTADLRVGDVIAMINDNPVETSMDLYKFLQSQAVGTMIKVQVYRRSDSQYHEMDVYLQEKIS